MMWEKCGLAEGWAERMFMLLR